MKKFFPPLFERSIASRFANAKAEVISFLGPSILVIAVVSSTIFLVPNYCSQCGWPKYNVWVMLWATLKVFALLTSINFVVNFFCISEKAR